MVSRTALRRRLVAAMVVLAVALQPLGAAAERPSSPPSESAWASDAWDTAADLPGAERPEIALVAAASLIVPPPRNTAPAIYPPRGAMRMQGGQFQLARQVEQPVQPATAPGMSGGLEPFQPPVAPASTGGGVTLEPFSAESIRQSLDLPPVSASSESLLSREVSAVPSTDLGAALSQSNAVQTLEVQRRSPVALDPNIRGFKIGQIYTQVDGQYFVPARQDLDTQLSKIDPSTTQQITIVPGPYAVQFGPGFTFIDITTTPLAFSDNGRAQNHYGLRSNIRTNGGQVYGREMISTAAGNFAFRISSGQRRGSDYLAGRNANTNKFIPASYLTTDVLAEFAYRLSQEQRIDASYSRVDQGDTEYAAQFFDLTFLKTDAFNLRYTDEPSDKAWSRFVAQGWFNQTNYGGNNANKARPDFPVVTRVASLVDVATGLATTPPLYPQTVLVGTTSGNQYNAGGRDMITFGDYERTYVNLGGDFRYLGQAIGEQITPLNNPVLTGTINTNLPRAWTYDLGSFAELSWQPLQPELRTTIGARGDMVKSNARASDLRPGSGLPGGTNGLSQSDNLYGFYMTNELTVSGPWKLLASLGHGQRAPTLTERYADGLFLGVLQSGLTRVIGDPGLRKERNYQVDLSTVVDGERFRGRLTGFYSWVYNYITYFDDSVVGPAGGLPSARLLRYTNTPLATLTGFQTYAEYDVNSYLTPFGSMQFVRGTDRGLDAPLPGISPLDSSVGLRFHDANGGRTWGFETICRMVNQQNRLGNIRVLGAATPIEFPTAGFGLLNLRAYYNATQRMNFVAGCDNVLNRYYQQHLDLRLVGPAGFLTSRVLSPGITPYFGLDWQY